MPVGSGTDRSLTSASCGVGGCGDTGGETFVGGETVGGAIEGDPSCITPEGGVVDKMIGIMSYN